MISVVRKIQARLQVRRPHLSDGASMVEYALLVALIAMIAFAAVSFAGEEVSQTYSDIAGSFQNLP